MNQQSKDRNHRILILLLSASLLLAQGLFLSVYAEGQERAAVDATLSEEPIPEDAEASDVDEVLPVEESEPEAAEVTTGPEEKATEVNATEENAVPEEASEAKAPRETAEDKLTDNEVVETGCAVSEPENPSEDAAAAQETAPETLSDAPENPSADAEETEATGAEDLTGGEEDAQIAGAEVLTGDPKGPEGLTDDLEGVQPEGPDKPDTLEMEVPEAPEMAAPKEITLPKAKAKLVLPVPEYKVGWNDVSGYRRYYYNKTSYYSSVRRKIKGNYYYFDANGNVQKGFFTENGKRYYANKKGVIRRKSGRFKVDNNYYYTNGKGVVSTNKFLVIKKKKYYATASGAFAKGIFTNGKSYYYANPKMVIRTKKGFFTWNGSRYYMKKGGKIRTSEEFKVGKKYYRAGANGAILTGVYKWGDSLWYSGKKGALRSEKGFFSWNGNRYYSEAGGRIYAGRVLKLDGKSYHTYASGIIALGVHKWGDDYYYADASTGALESEAKLITWNDKTYYIGKKGTITTNDTFFVGKNLYQADATGVCTVTSDPRAKLVSIMNSQLGVKTGKKYWKAIVGSTFVNGDRTPWCACFVAWCYKQAKLWDQVKNVVNKAYVPSYNDYAKKHSMKTRKNPKPGDLILYDRNRNGTPEHVGLVWKVVDGIVYSIEGNTGTTRNGEVLVRKNDINYSGIYTFINLFK